MLKESLKAKEKTHYIFNKGIINTCIKMKTYYRKKKTRIAVK